MHLTTWTSVRLILLNERRPKRRYYMISFMQNSGKRKLEVTERRSMVAWGQTRKAEGITHKCEENCEGDGYIHCFFIFTIIIGKLIQLHSLNMCSLLTCYIHPESIAPKPSLEIITHINFTIIFLDICTTGLISTLFYNLLFSLRLFFFM